MDHQIQPLETLLARAGAFAADRSVRLLHVGADTEMYRDALRAVAALEWSPRNRQHFIDATPTEDGPADWGGCHDRLIDEYQRIRTAYAAGGLTLPEVTAEKAAAPVVNFAVAVQRVARALSSPPAPTEGIVVVLGSGAFPERASMAEQLTGLIDAPALADVRWVVVEPGEAALGGLVLRLGPSALAVPCRVDREQQRAEVDGLLDALTNAPGTAAGPARMGGARPAASPPPRTGAPPAPDSLSASAHVPLFLRGVKALRSGDLPRAVQFQREALASCVNANYVTAALEMETLLAVYLGQLTLASGASIRPAIESFDGAIAKAISAGLPSIGSRAAMLQGVLATAGGDEPAAILALHRAALLAETAGAFGLQAEALRLAADLASRAGLEQRAAEFRERAARSGTAPPPAASGTGE